MVRVDEVRAVLVSAVLAEDKMQYLGEILSLTVAVSWTATALFADTASHRIGALPLNLFRMALSLVLLGGFLWVVCGAPWPVHADGRTWFWAFTASSSLT